MEIEHFGHEHTLYARDVTGGDSPKGCHACHKILNGPSYACERCRFWLHKSCAELPRKVLNSLHLQHNLTLFDYGYEYYICNECLYMCFGYCYRCHDCEFVLDLTCGSSTNNQLDTPKKEDQRKKQIEKQTIKHLSHNHQLTLCNYRKMHKSADDNYCRWCDRILSLGMCYACLKCNFYLHESCNIEMPHEIQHPFHPLHTLRLRYISYDTFCHACKRRLIPRDPYLGQQYQCDDCSFTLHARCANILPSLKHECHSHDLTYFERKAYEVRHDLAYFEGKAYEGSFECNSCGDICAGEDNTGGAFYRCVQCDFNLHFECVPIPYTAKHEYHRHFLTLMDSVIEDEYEQYYCDICEKERNPKHHVYYCKECNYIAHIECVLNERETLGEESLASSRTQLMDVEHCSEASSSNSKALAKKVIRQKETKQSNEEYPALIELDKEMANIQIDQQLQIQHFSHEHILHLSKAIYGQCNGCDLKICGPAYACESCKYFLHKTCAELPLKMLHPLHSQHPLTLLTNFHPDARFFVCDECRDVSRGFNYQCQECKFIIDTKCASLTEMKEGDQKLKELERKIEVSHFSHQHELAFVNCRDIDDIFCNGCQQPILGPAYCCPDCRFFLHESCLELLPKEIQHPCHPQHPLDIYTYFSSQRCAACGLTFNSITYSCRNRCFFRLHLLCANTLRRPLKHHSHNHNLYYFGKDILRMIENAGKLRHMNYLDYYTCIKCHEKCNEPFYRCVECSGNSFHLKCIPIPEIVKSERHVHPLTLNDSFVEDDYEEYYCDVCEEHRNPKDHVYCCEECNGLFVAHIECVISEMEERVSSTT